MLCSPLIRDEQVAMSMMDMAEELEAIKKDHEEEVKEGLNLLPM